MHKDNDLTHDHEENTYDVPTNAQFICPNDGKIDRDDVIFLCNKCEQADMIYKDGIYMCPACLNPGENFECLICESKEVKMQMKK
ncbi:hypothetical protein A2886_03380 [candidate division WWE3 bacterium RIFCSPHIGHO2_01_FULL_42_13]|uniref:Uncharacterized protein n=1 Tax=candidate division WWE3 bacterium RIFCSPHIGHO2_01_FULL_42_13 TaxID=1802617 RepID=A0A1F4UR99_UNCKA|nr:MAG: hypothetical protein A2886_03380 [candidate division WWE3 bacterium RIFCSPHIGHO2_01_FULL_42_13]